MDAETQGALKQLANEAASLLAAARESLRPPKQSSQLWPRAKDAAVILIPFVLGVAGYFVNLTLQTRETKARLVGLAIDILKAEPTGAEDNQRVRAWAVDVLARNSDVPIPAATRQDLQTTAVVPMGGIVGSDDRTVVTDTTSLPWAAVCQLSILASDGTQWIASGVLINPTTVITVDYVLFPSQNERGASATEITIIPGRNGDSEPFGRIVSRTFYRVESSAPGVEGLGVIKFKPTDQQLKWVRLSPEAVQLARSAPLTTAGYPGDKASGRTLVRSEGSVLQADEGLVYYDMDTFGGMSGSPVWRANDASFTLVAVHAGSAGKGKHGVRLTKELVTALQKLMSDS